MPAPLPCVVVLLRPDPFSDDFIYPRSLFSIPKLPCSFGVGSLVGHLPGGSCRCLPSVFVRCLRPERSLLPGVLLVNCSIRVSIADWDTSGSIFPPLTNFWCRCTWLQKGWYFHFFTLPNYHMALALVSLPFAVASGVCVRQSLSLVDFVQSYN